MTEKPNGWKNKLYFGDNLQILRDHVSDESVDLIYLDLPSTPGPKNALAIRPKNPKHSWNKS